MSTVDEKNEADTIIAELRACAVDRHHASLDPPTIVPSSLVARVMALLTRVTQRPAHNIVSALRRLAFARALILNNGDVDDDGEPVADHPNGAALAMLDEAQGILADVLYPRPAPAAKRGKR